MINKSLDIYNNKIYKLKLSILKFICFNKIIYKFILFNIYLLNQNH